MKTKLKLGIVIGLVLFSILSICCLSAVLINNNAKENVISADDSENYNIVCVKNKNNTENENEEKNDIPKFYSLEDAIEYAKENLSEEDQEKVNEDTIWQVWTDGTQYYAEYFKGYYPFDWWC